MRTERSRMRFLMKRPARAITCATLAVAFAAAPVISPVAAYAVSNETQTQLTETQQQVEETTRAYEEAQQNLDDLVRRIEETEAEIAQIEAQLPEQRTKAADAMRSQYKYRKTTNTLLSVVLGTTSLDDAISTLAYMDVIQDHANQDIERLNAMEAELEEKKAELTNAKVQAEEQQQKTADALAEAQRLRTEAQAKAEQEAAAELARLSTETSSGDTANQTVTETVSSGAVNWGMNRDQFISEWTARIDAYLSGSPLSGYGSVFASAAWDYGVDPRWSPAISCTESTMGTYCFRDFNAWGWMTSRQFGSWEESITAHVAFLAECYGPTLTPAAAQKYCPPTWSEWYSTVSGQMNLI